MRTLRRAALVVALFVCLPLHAQTGTWQGQLYTRAVWLNGTTPALQAAGKADAYTSPSSTVGTLQAQGATWLLNGIVFKLTFTDTKVNTLVIGHTARVLAYGAYTVGISKRQAVLDATFAVPDSGTPSLRYTIYALDTTKPDNEGAVIRATINLTKDPKAGYCYCFLPLTEPAL